MLSSIGSAGESLVQLYRVGWAACSCVSIDCTPPLSKCTQRAQRWRWPAPPSASAKHSTGRVCKRTHTLESKSNPLSTTWLCYACFGNRCQTLSPILPSGLRFCPGVCAAKAGNIACETRYRMASSKPKLHTGLLDSLISQLTTASRQPVQPAHASYTAPVVHPLEQLSQEEVLKASGAVKAHATSLGLPALRFNAISLQV